MACGRHVLCAACTFRSADVTLVLLAPTSGVLACKLSCTANAAPEPDFLRAVCEFAVLVQSAGDAAAQLSASSAGPGGWEQGTRHVPSAIVMGMSRPLKLQPQAHLTQQC